MKIGERLKELRTNRGISQGEFADIIGVSKSAVSMYETNARTPDLETLETIADYYNVSIDYLTGKEDRSMYYLDPEAAELADEMHKRPELKVLFKASKNVSKDDLQYVSDLLERLKREQFGDDD